MDTATRVQIMDENVCCAHDADILGKDMNPNIVLPSVDKVVGQIGLFIFGMEIGQKE